MEIHVMRADGSEDRRITDNRVEDRFPAWSPDGAYLAWTNRGDFSWRTQTVRAPPVAYGTFLSWIP
jgi:Tol biopolymer transport system component